MRILFILLMIFSMEAAAQNIQVYAHRGMRSYVPEHTMQGYKTVLRLGTDWVDTDIVMTKDGEIVVSHDLVLNPDIVKDAKGKFLVENPDKYTVKNLTLRELQEFDVGGVNPKSQYAGYFPDQITVPGARIPTLREVIRYVNKTSDKKVNFQIEMKTDPAHPELSPDPKIFAEALYKILKEENILDRAEIQAFDYRCLYELQKLDSRIKTSYLTARDNEEGNVKNFFHKDPKIAGLWTGGKLVKDYGNSIPKMIKALGGSVWSVEDAQLTKKNLDEAKKLGLKVVVWTWPEELGTAFDPKLVEKMIQWKVDGIITDDANRLNSMLAARDMRIPRGLNFK